MRYIFLSIVSVLLCSCIKTETTDTGNGSTMRIPTFYTKAAESSQNGPDFNPQIIIYRLSSLPALSQDGELVYIGENVAPYYVGTPNAIISDFDMTAGKDPFDTGEYYPLSNESLVCVGYSPANSGIIHSTNFSEIYLPAEKLGQYDFLAYKHPLYGSLTQPFDGDPSNRILQFIHAQSKVNFFVCLKEGFPKNVTDVKIKVKREGNLATRLRAADRFRTYTYESVSPVNTLTDPVKTMTYPDEIVIDPDLDGLLPEESASFPEPPSHAGAPEEENNPWRYIGSVYLIPGKSSLTITLTCKMFAINQSVEDATSFDYTDKVVEFDVMRSNSDPDDSGKETNTLYANEEYTVGLKLDEKSVNIQGHRVEWVNGGHIPIPVYPYSPIAE